MKAEGWVPMLNSMGTSMWHIGRLWLTKNFGPHIYTSDPIDAESFVEEIVTGEFFSKQGWIF